MLKGHGVEAVADVRRFPGSRRLPWFNADSLSVILPPVSIAYWPFPGLGGRRKATQDSANLGWRNESFRGYADYMQTPLFAEALNDLVSRAASKASALMCAEAVPWRCHRSLIADALLVRGWTVLDIYDQHTVKPHTLTPFARVDGLRISYPAAPEQAAPSLFGRERG